ncbi:MAG: DinB family protein [Bacteroidota bacterium]|nr:DinB family protein [Bacteroidota bacterium]
MTKQEIINKLLKKHIDFIELIKGLSDQDFMFSFDNKWTAGQQLDHIVRSVSPLKMAFSLPKFVIRMLFGKANRPSKNYDDLVKKYMSKLETGGVATGRFVPQTISLDKKEQLTNSLLKVVKDLSQKIDKYSEAQLDEYLLPHPLLGKLTIREMLFFTIHHVEQHQKITLRNLGR